MTATTTLCVGDGVVDPIAAPVLAAVLDAVMDLYEELAPKGVVGPCSAGVMAGSAAAVDRGRDVVAKPVQCAGMLWVRLIDLYPSANFPAPDVFTVGDRLLSFAVEVEIGVARPAPVETKKANTVILPSMAEETDAAAIATVDAAVVRQALLAHSATKEIGLVLGQYVPFGPEGGVVGGATTVTIQVV